jgi:hypothetical protein
MPSQIFVVSRAPEAEPIEARLIRQMVAAKRTDSEWEVHECELQAAKLVPRDVARAIRANANTRAATDERQETTP